mmetsp:Transcript_26561/g.57072  ORF Transcript_26561/g.57072 Transcript_26561/m.57072 type:complete len:385 (+) Transcript_26561:55-1209(+)
MMSILGGGRKWKSKFQSGAGVGRGLHTLMHQGSHWVTVGSSVTMNGDTPDNGYLIERGSDDAILIKAKIYSKLRQEADKDNTTPLLSKDLPAAELDSPSKHLSAAELDLPVATPSPKQTEMSNSNKRKALSDKSLEDTEEGSPDNTDKVIDDTMNDISDRLLVELEKQLSKLSSMPDIRLQSFSQSILARCLARSTASNGVIKLSSVDERNHVLSNTYMKMPSCRVCNPSSTKESKKRFAKKKATLINTFIDSILDTHSDHGKEMMYRVLRKVADQREMVVLKRERVEQRNKRPRGYNTNMARKQQDQIAYSSSIFSSTETVNGEEYLVLFGGQGRIHSKYRDQFLYVKTGRAPDDWVDGFLQTELLSEAKLEQAKHAVHCKLC